MELNLSTMILEVINFLVLVWILKRFLYHPVLNIIDKRKHDIEQKLDLAQNDSEQAKALQQQYEQRLHNWSLEQQRLRDQLNNDLAKERDQRIEQLELELSALREKAQQIELRQKAESLRSLEYQALEQANQFSAKLLSELACPALQDKLLQLLLNNLARLSQHQLAEHKHHWKNQQLNAIKIQSAFPLSDEQKSELQNALKRLVKLDLAYEYRQQSSLLAGLQISIGSWVIHANLANELRAFTEFAHENGDDANGK